MAKLCFTGILLQCLVLCLASVQAISGAGYSAQLSTVPSEAPVAPVSAANWLLELKANISDPLGNLRTWDSAQVVNFCNWTGIRCNQFSQVEHIDLSGLNLGGGLSPSVGYISELKTLDLSFNNFTGVLPETFGLLSKLQMLNFTSNKFTGSIPLSLSRCHKLKYFAVQSNQLSGPIPSEIGQLANLQYLHMSDNDLVGSIPSSLGNCSKLLMLDLSMNALTGPIPSSLGNCSLLSVLVLGSNELGDSIPAELEHLSQLKVLNVSMAQLSGSVPRLLFNLTALQVVDFSQNQLAGSLPEVWSAANLTNFNLSRNMLEGEIPEEIGSLESLRYLDLSKNLLTGEIPSSLGSCRHLETLDLGTNDLGGFIPSELGHSQCQLKILHLQLNDLSGTIPESLQNCAGLVSFAVDRNIGITGTIPSWLGQLENLTLLSLYNCAFQGGFPDLSGTPLLKKLYLDANQLEGPIPPDAGNWWPNIDSIFAAENNLNGSIPGSLGSCRKLEVLSLGYNRLSGTLPPEFGNIASLLYLALSSNLIEGGVPKTFGNLTQLQVSGYCQADVFPCMLLVCKHQEKFRLLTSLVALAPALQLLILRKNKLDGVIPDELSNCENLNLLDLSSNAFSGQLPSWLGRLNKTLRTLDVHNNNLSGGIPVEVGYCTILNELDLSHNKLSGEIPASLGELTKLTANFDLSQNMLTGPIPPEFGSMAFVQAMNLSFNQISGSIPRSLRGCGSVELLDFSHNSLVGDIPLGLARSSSNQWLASVQVMNFSFNSLNGTIPDDFSGLQTLQSLDLSHNQLSGRIPEALADLNNLTFLNLSYNEFVGEVPTGGRFGGLTMESFLGNPGLCGELLHKKCGSSTGIRRWVLVTLIVGVGAGALATSWILVWWYHYRQPQAEEQTEESGDMLVFDSQFDLSVRDIWLATDGYSDSKIIGSGGASVVYEGTLADGRHVAVKRIREEDTVGLLSPSKIGAMEVNVKSDNEVSRSFVTEMQLLGKLRHRNLVRLLGCHVSTTGAVKAIVLEHLQRGNLEQALYGKELCSCRIDDTAHLCGKDSSSACDTYLSWAERLSIALDVARGLVYLHFECPEPIIHCDLKPANILLDEDGVAHIGDFGIARVLAGDMAVSIILASKLRGSLGYLAPGTGRFVYCFGYDVCLL